MRITPFEHGLNLAQPSEGYVRTPGLHMSDIYGSLYKSIDPKRYDKKGKDGKAQPFDLTKMELGTSFEELLEPVIAARILGQRPGEFVTIEPPGIIYSPDYLFFDLADDTVLGEFKLTWYSSRNAPYDPKFDKWFTQMKSYLYHLEMERARLFVLFVNGNYKPPSPELLAWDIRFTQRELKDNWNTMERHAKKVGLL